MDVRVACLDHTKEETSVTAHPNRVLATVRCASCGNVFTTRSTRSEITLDVCANCHPAYTGVERPIHSGSRIDRFERRRARASLAIR
jgi:large subunit ribosomal protein L31